MNLFFILLLIALIGAGYYVYQRLLAIEREIRADQKALATEEPAPVVSGPTEVQAVPDVSKEQSSEDGLVDRIKQAVEDSPGMTQTELYERFSSEDRRDLQKLLRQLDQQAQLRREKKGSSYRLYPL